MDGLSRPVDHYLRHSRLHIIVSSANQPSITSAQLAIIPSSARLTIPESPWLNRLPCPRQSPGHLISLSSPRPSSSSCHHQLSSLAWHQAGSAGHRASALISPDPAAYHQLGSENHHLTISPSHHLTISANQSSTNPAQAWAQAQHLELSRSPQLKYPSNRPSGPQLVDYLLGARRLRG